MLHLLDVGEVGLCGGGTMAYWRLWLPGCSGFGRAGSLQAARDHLTSKIEQWIDAAGLVATPYPDIRAFCRDWSKIKQARRT